MSSGILKSRASISRQRYRSASIGKAPSSPDHADQDWWKVAVEAASLASAAGLVLSGLATALSLRLRGVSFLSIVSVEDVILSGLSILISAILLSLPMVITVFVASQWFAGMEDHDAGEFWQLARREFNALSRRRILLYSATASLPLLLMSFALQYSGDTKLLALKDGDRHPPCNNTVEWMGTQTIVIRCEPSGHLLYLHDFQGAIVAAKDEHQPHGQVEFDMLGASILPGTQPRSAPLPARSASPKVRPSASFR